MDNGNSKAKALFASRLAALLRRKDMKQNELARALDVAESTVGKWLLTKSIPRMGTIQKIADFFGVGKSYLLEEDATIDGYIPVTIHADAVRNIVRNDTPPPSADAERLRVVGILRGLQSDINAALERAVADIMWDGGEILTAERNRRIKKDSTTSDAG